MSARGVLFLAAVALVGCREERPKRTAPVIARTAPDAAVTANVDAGTLELARAARNEALALASRCKLYGSYDDNAVRYHDSCTWDDGHLDAFRKASSALLAAAADAGAAVVFIAHVRLFREWVDLHSGFYHGALSHYQDLARAWNAFQPQDPIAIDPYDKETGDRLPADAGALTWQRCTAGPCVVFIERQ